MNLCNKIFGRKKSGKNISEAVKGTGMTSQQNVNPEPHIQSLPEQSNVVRKDGNLNSGNSMVVIPGKTGVTNQNENPGRRVQCLPEQSNIHQNGNVQPELESGGNESVTGGKKGSGVRKTKDQATQIHSSSRTITKPTTSREEKRKAMGVEAAAGPAPRSLKAGKATGVTISEPSTRITRSKAAVLPEPSRTSTKAEKSVDVLEPSTSSTKVEKGKAEVGVTISKPSKSTTAEKGKAKVGVTISEPSKSSTAEKGRAKIEETISEPSKSTTAAKGKAELVANSEAKKRRTSAETTAEKEKAKGVTISERKTTTNAARQEEGKGNFG